MRDTISGKVSTLAVTGVFVAIGHDPRSELVRDVLDTDPDGYVLVRGRTTATSMEGVFAAGRPGGPHLPAGRHRRGQRLCSSHRRRTLARRARRLSAADEGRHRLTVPI